MAGCCLRAAPAGGRALIAPGAGGLALVRHRIGPLAHPGPGAALDRAEPGAPASAKVRSRTLTADMKTTP